ncbi:type II toxin-antitoxin system PemK/MazF family toxin [Brevundimonas sp. NIBR10]|uniref:type II toxin-antitoxin system PemK/MazF family toxin n=1 Tax=Brevundimonas sp. NIBR10 TaxID=3015997 RepID=UPI0022F15AB6|nr:type II toxin-antitoxin system PemK/MazF family toxin [Brevundimonas sp. NIBR10]
MIALNYLWRREADTGREEARYPRPCVIVLALETRAVGPNTVVTVPVTHSAPRDSTSAIELPPSVKKSLGLDDLPSWIVTDEANIFQWPGHDLARRRDGTVEYGFLPPGLFARVRSSVEDTIKQGRLKRVLR